MLLATNTLRRTQFNFTLINYMLAYSYSLRISYLRYAFTYLHIHDFDFMIYSI